MNLTKFNNYYFACPLKLCIFENTKNKTMKHLSIFFLLIALFSSCLMDTYSENGSSYRVQTNLTVTDIDGNIYNTVTIGTQTWMVENLKTTKYNDGAEIPLVEISDNWYGLSTPGYGIYNQNALYNFYAVNTGKLAPYGWHVPTDVEWSILESCANSKALASISGWRSSTTIGAVGNDQLQNNSSGFNAQPDGYRLNDGSFVDAKLSGVWWSSTENTDIYAWCRTIYYDYCYVQRYYLTKHYGFSVRCIKDN